MEAECEVMQPPPILRTRDDVPAVVVVPVSLDDTFPRILLGLMLGQSTVADAVTQFYEKSMEEAARLREEASQQLHRAAHYLHLRRLADELQGQAATWLLVYHLHCNGNPPVGMGGPPLEGVGRARTYRQQLCAAVRSEPELQHMARIVTWLEALAAQRLDALGARRGAGGGAAAHGFAHHECVWVQTKSGARKSGGGEVALDFDAVTREQVKLAAGDHANEERLSAKLWQLMRAGRVREARQLCIDVGQPWRAASIGGAGDWGPLPVGQAAAEQDALMSEQQQAEDLAAEMDSLAVGGLGGGAGGGAGARGLWCWACYSAAEAAASGEAAQRFEAAVYGALCSSVAHMRPVCAGWEDEAWMFCRSWMELGAQEAAAAAAGSGGAQGLGAVVDAMPAELLCGLLGGENVGMVAEGLAAAAGGWPMPRVVAASERPPRVGDQWEPPLFDHLERLLATSPNAAVSGACADYHRLMQLRFMARDVYGVVRAAVGCVYGSAPEAGQPGAGDADAGAGGGGGGGDGGRLPADVWAARVRFSAHLALVIRALAELPDPRLVKDEAELRDVAQVQDVVEHLVCDYAVALVADPSVRGHSVLYLCQVQTHRREPLAAQLVRSASADGDEAQQLALVDALRRALDNWREHQAKLKYDSVRFDVALPGRPTSCLYGNIRVDELRLLLVDILLHSRKAPRDTPSWRVRLLSWLFATFKIAAAGGSKGSDGLEPLPASDAGWTPHTWRSEWTDALLQTLGMAGELALAPAPLSAALPAALLGTVPEQFLGAAAYAAQWHGRWGGPREVGVSPEQREAAADASRAFGRWLERRHSALAFWQAYARLQEAYLGWKRRPGGGTPGARGVAEAERLAGELLALAAADLLEPLACAAGADDDDAAIADVVRPHSTPADVRPGQVRLHVTRAPQRAAGAADADAGGTYPVLTTREQEALWLELTALIATDEVTSWTMAGDRLLVTAGVYHELPGVVVLDVTLLRTETPGAEARAVVAAAAAARLVAWLVGGARWRRLGHSGESDGGDGGRGGGSGGRGGPRRLAVVYMETTLAMAAAIARHRTGPKLLLRCAKVLHHLARLGHASAVTDRLLEAVAAAHSGAVGASPLLRLLLQEDAVKLQRLLEEVMEGAPPREDAHPA